MKVYTCKQAHLRTSELVGHDLNVAVHKALNMGHPWRYYGQAIPNYCNEWKDGGPIINAMGGQGIILMRATSRHLGWRASLDFPNRFCFGPTPLIAAMRCYVISELGDEIEIQKELYHT